jgi:hypothetical protein
MQAHGSDHRRIAYIQLHRVINAGQHLPSEESELMSGLSIAGPSRRSSARRAWQRVARPGVLPQNGAGHEQWCAAALGRVGAGEQAEV